MYRVLVAGLLIESTNSLYGSCDCAVDVVGDDDDKSNYDCEIVIINACVNRH
jgi:hypothetical protein